MKVLTIREPFASLILNKIKTVETRSWKTNYRGELYIHAGKAKVDKKVLCRKELMNLVHDKYRYGNIICKCKLVDCIYMTEEYIADMKKNHYDNYISGEYKVGRYAWVLEEVEKIEPIKANGQLGLWNY